MELTDFLLARIAEDEEAAQEALAPGEMHPWGDCRLPEVAPMQVPNEVRGYLGGTWGEHFARWNPARVLAECEAKRRIVAEHPLVPSDTATDVIGCDLCGWRYFSWGPELTEDGPCATLRALALPYASHPSYDPAWRP